MTPTIEPATAAVKSSGAEQRDPHGGDAAVALPAWAGQTSAGRPLPVP